MLSRRNVTVFSVIVVTFVVIGIIFWRLQPVSPEIKKAQQAGAALQAQGIETQEDYVKFDQIRSQIKQKKAISDPDLDWMLALMKKHSTHPEIVVVDVTGMLSSLKSVTSSQRQSIFDAAVPLLTSNSSTDTYHFIPQAAANVLGHLGDAKAVPYIKPLLNDPDPDVRKRAQHALDELHQTTAVTGTTL